MLSLRNQVAIVTGIGCRDKGWSNGLAIATLLARQGAAVFGCDIDPDAADCSKSRILSDVPNTDVTVMRANATSGKSMAQFVEACMKKHGRVDILVNNVGRSEPGDPASMPESVWDQQINVNLKSAYLTTHLVLPIMEKQTGGGNVVNISSVAGLRYIGKPQVAYSASKAAITQFTKVTAVLYASKGVRLNVVTPGLIDTPLVQRLADKYFGGQYDQFREHRAAQVPMGRMGTAWDVAHAVLFLASKEASYITGAELVVDGAFTCSTGEERRGLGAALVEHFVAAGAFVVNADLTPIQSSKPAASMFVKCDVSIWNDQVKLFKSAIAASPKGAIDVVIANAGISRDDRFIQGLDESEPVQPDLKILDVNVIGTIYTAKLAAYYFHKQPKDIFDRCLILTSSIMAYIDTYGVPSYGVSKHAVRGLMCTLRRRHLMRVNSIAPWYLPTPIMSEAWKKSLSVQFQEHGTDWAHVDDAVQTVQNIIKDHSIDGRSFAIVPRQMEQSGSIDLKLDEFEDNSMCGVLQKVTSQVVYVDLPLTRGS
ncbi:hypothetical protein B7463_g10046, partial [Scytalidium lignicola]